MIELLLAAAFFTAVGVFTTSMAIALLIALGIDAIRARRNRSERPEQTAKEAGKG